MKRAGSNEKLIREKGIIKIEKMTTLGYKIRRLFFPSQRARLLIFIVCLVGVYLSYLNQYWFGSLISLVLAFVVFYMK